MKIGQSGASKPRVFVGHSNESLHGNHATARAAKDKETGQHNFVASWVKPTVLLMSKTRTAIMYKPMIHQKNDCQARCKSQERLCEEGHQRDLAVPDDKVTDKTSNSKRRADDTKAPHKGVITGVIRGIWRNEEQSFISSLRETQDVPCGDELRPLLSDILAKVEDCFEQKEKKPAKRNPTERSESIGDTARKLGEARRLEHDCKPPGLSNIKNNNKPYDPMQDWPYSASLDTSNSIFNNASLHHPDDGRNWHCMGPNSITAMENIVAHQVSIENFAFTEDDLHSAQMPDMFD
ncbi:hypothetical protein FMUND_314 [Fusarium mundagurra]|uniref:Uncharacterized protein n=1 Tax=Fusarium mundagurra TaxID=1567541 RepID=A0A8H6DPX1_9HYPO|nr:hypothetical protein FMUND_314 [Fusarium mundagurra]